MRVSILFAACGLWAAGAHARTEKCDDFIVDSAGRRITVLSNGYPLAMREIEAAAKLGVEVVELDDGWQKGRSSNSHLIKNRKKDGVWNGYWAFDANFWDADLVRFSHGLAPLAAAARIRPFG